MEQWAELRREHFVGGQVDQGAGAVDGAVAQHDPAGAAQRPAAELSAGAAAERAGAVQAGDPPAAEEGLDADGRPGPRAARAAGLHGVEDGRRRLPARGPAVVRAAAEDVSADGLSAGRDLPVRRLAAARGGPGRPRPDAPRLGRRRVPGLLARRRRRVGLLAARPRTCSRGIAGCLERLGGLPQTLVWDRQAGIHGHGGRPTEAFAAFCGQLRVDWHFCEPADPQAKGVVERLQGYAETNFEPGRVFANELDFQDQLDAWFVEGQRAHAQDAARAADRSPRRRARGDGAAARADARHRPALDDARPARPAPARRHQRLLAGSRRSSAAASRSSPTSAASRRSRWTPASWPAATRAVFARHRTITALEHARALRAGRRRSRRDAGRGPAAGPLRRPDRMTRADDRARAPVPPAQGARGRASAAQARRPRPRRGVVATSSSPPPC